MDKAGSYDIGVVLQTVRMGARIALPQELSSLPLQLVLPVPSGKQLRQLPGGAFAQQPVLVCDLGGNRVVAENGEVFIEVVSAPSAYEVIACAYRGLHSQ